MMVSQHKPGGLGADVRGKWQMCMLDNSGDSIAVLTNEDWFNRVGMELGEVWAWLRRFGGQCV